MNLIAFFRRRKQQKLKAAFETLSIDVVCNASEAIEGLERIGAAAKAASAELAVLNEQMGKAAAAFAEFQQERIAPGAGRAPLFPVDRFD